MSVTKTDLKHLLERLNGRVIKGHCYIDEAYGGYKLMLLKDGSAKEISQRCSRKELYNVMVSIISLCGGGGNIR